MPRTNLPRLLYKESMATPTLWIDWLGRVHDTKGVVGTLVCGPIGREKTAVYVVKLIDGNHTVDWKDILIQLAKGGEVKHYRGLENL